ncbi:MAG TPA: HD domain-containing phosphohydrolase [Solirubrobacteraceae bacterium]|jgi:putative nucleotidyltransferase with HDIG domain
MRSLALRQLVAVSVACACLAGCVVWAAVVAPNDHVNGLSAVLFVAAVAAGLGVAQVRHRSEIFKRVEISASFIVYILAGAFLGPTSAFIAAAVSEVAATRVSRTRPAAFLFNLVAAGFAALLAGTLIRDLAPQPHSAGFYLVLGGLALCMLELTWVIIAPFYIAYDGYSPVWSPRTLIDHLPSALINVVLAVAGAAIYVEIGLAGIAFALAAVIAFSYMAHLLNQSGQRAEQYVSLSWGVLAGLLRALDTRDGRAARHAAAVARFASDMAEAVGMSEHDQELAHTAGLLHDIGNFALSDRVAERGRTLTEEDWVAIQQHPELGADMLQDLGMYGPIAEIVLTHHERIDGRGYPRNLPGEEIPAIAKIIAVAEVYDTLTAADTYRTRMSSFEALRELRRVAGSQLDADYVEVLAGLLSGEGVDYRHADAANFDSELDMERRIKQARAG